MTTMEQMGARAKAAARVLAVAGPKKDGALLAMAAELEIREAEILAANEQDLIAARANNMPLALQDRLALSRERVLGMAEGLRQVAAQNDPIGEVVSGSLRPNGLSIKKLRVPLGVVGIIFEARPNVTADAAALCLKAGNAVILRGGKEAIRSNTAIAGALRGALIAAGLPVDAVQLVADISRESAREMMRLTGFLDLLIPRGGAGLIRAVVAESRVPVIETGVGNCHIYVDEGADLAMAENIVFNAKTSRPSVCNSAEKLLVHRSVAKDFLPRLEERLNEKHVALRACPEALALLKNALPATDDDWDKEYLDYILGIRVVADVEEAIAHIARHSSGHSECIVTNNLANAAAFTARVDAAAVYVNASTRFTDGGMFGLGAEIGISTQKLHARGPMGANELTSTKFIVEGMGQTRE